MDIFMLLIFIFIGICIAILIGCFIYVVFINKATYFDRNVPTDSNKSNELIFISAISLLNDINKP